MLTVKHQIPWCNNYTAWKWVVRHNDDLVTTGCTRGCHPVGHQHWLKRWITIGIIIFHLSSSGSANSLLRVSYSCYQPYNWIKSIGDISMQYTFHLSLYGIQCDFTITIYPRRFGSCPPPCRIGLFSWRQHTETLSASLARCKGNPPVTGEFTSQRASKRGPGCFISCQPKQTGKQTLELPVIWDALMIMTSP